MVAYAARANPSAGCDLLFDLYRVPRDGHSVEAELTNLKLVVGPGDEGEPVMTIPLPNEDSPRRSMPASSPWPLG